METLLAESFGKDSLILMMSLILFDEACTYVGLMGIDDVWFFLKNFNMARMLLLGLEGIRRGSFDTWAYLSCFDEPWLLSNIFFGVLVLNWEEIHCLKELPFL